MTNLATSMRHSAGGLSQSNYIRKRKKRHLHWKRRSKIILFPDILIYINSKDSTKTVKTHLKITKITGEKSNVQNILEFLYINKVYEK
jgi:hypothetical protein